MYWLESIYTTNYSGITLRKQFTQHNYVCMYVSSVPIVGSWELDGPLLHIVQREHYSSWDTYVPICFITKPKSCQIPQLKSTQIEMFCDSQ